MDVSVKLEDDNEVILKAEISEDSKNPNLIFFNLVSVKDGKSFLKFKFFENKIEVVEQDPSITEDIDLLKGKLEELLVELNPNKSVGTEDTESEEEGDETPYDPDKIRVDTKAFSLHQIKEMIDRNDINLTPDFQRNLVWDNKRKSRLIESILMRIPLPMFYFSQDEEGRISVVDGLQRLSTIREFMDNKLRLRDLEYLEEKCSGKTYTDKNASKAIDPKYYRWFNMTQITVNVIDPSSPFKLKYDIFRRINTGGQPLNAQEIRNCLSSDSLRQALREMASLESFGDATGWSIKDVRMDGQELALRFILFTKRYAEDKTLNNYSGSIEWELNELTDDLSKDKKFDYKTYVNLFDTAMQNAFHLFGRYSFRKCKVEHIRPDASRQLINKALFVCWSVLLSPYDSRKVDEKNESTSLALPLAKMVSSNNDLFQYLTYSTNSKVNIQAAFKAAEEIINKNLNH